MRKEILNLHEIWSEENYLALATEIEKHVHAQVRDLLPRMDKTVYSPTDHRIENTVRKIAAQEGLMGLHLGLTSSDIEDNVRLMQLKQTIELVDVYRFQVLEKLSEFIYNHKDEVVVGRTHLIPAQFTTLGYRFMPAFEMLVYAHAPSVMFKGIGGVVGNGALLGYMGANRIRNPWGEPEQDTSNQTSCFIPELSFAYWINKLSAVLSQYAYNVRLMFSYNQLTVNYHGVGSSAVAAKRPNPYKWERVCGRAKATGGLIPVITANIATNGLERTLDNQTNLHELIPFYADQMIKIMQDVLSGMDELEVNHRAIAHECAEEAERMASEVLQLEVIRTLHCSREKAKDIVYNHYNRKNRNVVHEGVMSEEAYTRLLDQGPQLGDYKNRMLDTFIEYKSLVSAEPPRWLRELGDDFKI